MSWRHLWEQKNKIWLWSAVNHFSLGILGWVVGDHSAETFRPLWDIVGAWQCYFYVTDGWTVYPSFLPEGDQICQQDLYDTSGGEKHPLATLSGSTAAQDLVLFQVSGDAKTLDPIATALSQVLGYTDSPMIHIFIQQRPYVVTSKDVGQ